MIELPDSRLPIVGEGAICAASDLVWDFIVLLDQPVIAGGVVDATFQGVRGGSAANVADAVAFAGARSRFLGQISDDALGAQMVDEMFRHGVEIRGAKRGRSAQLLSLVNPNGDRSFVVDTGSQNDLYPEDIDDTWLEAAAILHISGYSFVRPQVSKTMHYLATLAHAQGMAVTLDPGSPNCIVEYETTAYLDALESVKPDVMFVNEDEALALGIDISLTQLPRGVNCVVVHRGPLPTVVLHDGERLEIATPIVLDIVDTTGAGDSFAAGFLVGWQRGLPIRGCVELGHELAGQTITRAGACLF